MLLNPRDPFYAPLWRRVVLVAFCAGWAAFELWSGALIWAAMVGGLGAYAFWLLIATYPGADAAPPPNPASDTPDDE